MVTYLGSLIQWCCGDGGALQTNIPGVCSQCPGRTGFAPAHGVCAFPVYTAQAPGCSVCNSLRRALGCVHFPDLNRSGSGSQVLHKGADSVRPGFCALPRSEQLRRPGAWQVHSPPGRGGGLHLITSPVPAAQFSGCTTGVPAQADVDSPESQEVLVSNEACLQFGR